MKYHFLALDVFNLVWKLHEKNELAAVVGPKSIYPQLVANTIEKIKGLKEKYLADGGRVYLLFDYFSPGPNIRKQFKNFSGRKQISENYKSTRANAPIEMINSLAILRYYYLAQTEDFVTIQIQNREADDLVSPLLTYLEAGETGLLVTNDSDWTRYLSSKIHWLPYLEGEPKTPEDFFEDKGYYPSENSVVLYKALFGDDSDDVPKLLPHNPKNHEEFKELLREYGDIAPIRHVDTAGVISLREASKVLQAINEDPSQFRINIQLVEAQPIGEKHFRSRICVGRDSKVITSSVEIALGAKKSKKSFTFGSIFVKGEHPENVAAET